MTVKNTKAVKTVPVLIRVPPLLLKKIDAAARADDRSRTYVVVDLLKERFGARRVEA